MRLLFSYSLLAFLTFSSNLYAIDLGNMIEGAIKKGVEQTVNSAVNEKAKKDAEKAKKDALEAAKALNCPTPKEGECLCSGKSIKHLESGGKKLRDLLAKSWRNCKIVLITEDAEGTYQTSYNVDAKGKLLPIKGTMIAKFKNGDILDDQKKTFYDASANITCKSEDVIKRGNETECKTKFSDANKKWVNNMAYYYMYNHYIKRCVASGLITKNYHKKFLGKVKNLSGKFADYFKVDKKNIDSLKIEANQLWKSDLTKSRGDALATMAMVKMQLDIGFNQNSIGDVYMTDMGTMSMGKASMLCDSVKDAYQQSMGTTMRAFKKEQSKKNPGSDDNLDF